MSVVTTYQAIVENGQVKLPTDVRLPEHATVYVVVPAPSHAGPIRSFNSRTLRPADPSLFVKTVTEEPPDLDPSQPLRIMSPHHARKEDAARFEMEVVEDPTDAGG